MSKREYTDEFKREVLAMAAKGEKSISELERDLGITPGLVENTLRMAAATARSSSGMGVIWSNSCCNARHFSKYSSVSVMNP